MWRKFENFEGGHLWKQWVSVYEVTVYRCQMCVAPANSPQYFKPTKVKLPPPPTRLIFQMPQSHTDEKTAEPRATWQPLAAALPGSPTQIDYRSRWRSATVFSFQMSLMRHPPCCLFTNSSSLWRPHSFFFSILFSLDSTAERLFVCRNGRESLPESILTAEVDLHPSF